MSYSWPSVLTSVWELSFGKIGSAVRIPEPSREPKKARFHSSSNGKNYRQIVARAVDDDIVKGGRDAAEGQGLERFAFLSFQASQLPS